MKGGERLVLGGEVRSGKGQHLLRSGQVKGQCLVR